MRKDVLDPVTDAWFNLLNHQLSYEGQEVKVYPVDADNTDDFHYVLIYSEGETDESNGSRFVTNAVIVVDIVTKHSIAIKKTIVNNIYNQIIGLLFPTRQCALTTTGFQILNVRPDNSSSLEEGDESGRIYRKTTRFFHRINQLT